LLVVTHPGKPGRCAFDEGRSSPAYTSRFDGLDRIDRTPSRSHAEQRSTRPVGGFAIVSRYDHQSGAAAEHSRVIGRYVAAARRQVAHGATRRAETVDLDSLQPSEGARLSRDLGSVTWGEIAWAARNP
jgi:hypothetical protein